MPTYVTGQLNTSNINEKRKVWDMDNTIHILEPSATPIATLLKRLPQEQAEGVLIEWMEKRPIPQFINSEAHADASGASTLVFADYKILVNKDILINSRTKEIIQITAQPTSSTVTVYRGRGSIHAAVLATDEWQKIGSGHGQGSLSIQSVHVKEEEKSNYQQIFKKTASAANSTTKQRMYGGDLRSSENRFQAIELMKELDRALCWGAMYSGVDEENNPIYAMKGFFGPDGWIQSHRYDLSSGYTQRDFETYLSEINIYNTSSEDLIGFGGETALRGISSFLEDKLQVVYPSRDQDKMTYGLAVSTYVTVGAKLKLVVEKQWQGGYFGRCLGVLNLKNARMRNLRNIVQRENIQAAERDGWKDEWIGEQSLKCVLEETGGFFEGM